MEKFREIEFQACFKCSENNTFCIIPSFEDFFKIERIVKESYNEWRGTNSESLGDYVKRRLKEENVKFEIYFKDEE